VSATSEPTPSVPPPAPTPALTPAPRLRESRAFSAPVLAATAVLAGIVAAVQPSPTLSVLRAVLVLTIVPCAVIDYERRIIPNRITGPAAAAAIVLGCALDLDHEPRRLLWAVLAGAFLLIAALVNPAGMGMGDVKLLAVMGLLLGAPVVIALFVALLATLALGVGLALRGGVRAARKTALPFGPYLAVGGVVAAVVGSSILHALGHH
jgi:leader peptidase (prepilin peptidase)/N-methyltransferase